MDKRLGHYQIVRMLGSGGMGQVYEAVHDQMKRRAAIKILHKRFAHNRQIATRFLNEAKATSMAEHPGIVHIYEFGQTDDGIAYIVMEYLSGETLRQRLDGQGGKLPPDDVMRLGRQMASALQAAHEKGIVHRDLKPVKITPVENIAKTSHPPREQSAEVGKHPKPPKSLRCTSVAKPTNRRPRNIGAVGRASFADGPNSGACDCVQARTDEGAEATPGSAA